MSFRYRGKHKGSTLKARGKSAGIALNVFLAVVLVVGLSPHISFATNDEQGGQAENTQSEIIATDSAEEAQESDSAPEEASSDEAAEQDHAVEAGDESSEAAGENSEEPAPAKESNVIEATDEEEANSVSSVEATKSSEEATDINSESETLADASEPEAASEEPQQLADEQPIENSGEASQVGQYGQSAIPSTTENSAESAVTDNDVLAYSDVAEVDDINNEQADPTTQPKRSSAKSRAPRAAANDSAELDELELSPMASDERAISVSVLNDTTALAPYSGETAYYSKGDVKLQVKATGLTVGDKVKIEGTGDYTGWASSTEVTVDSDELTDEITLSTEKSYAGGFTVTITPKDESEPITQTFDSGIVIDKTAPQVTDFKFDRNVVAPSGDATGAQTQYFNLDNNGTAEQVKLSATLTEVNLATKNLKLTGLDGAKAAITAENLASAWTDEGSGTYKLSLSFGADNFVDTAGTALLVAHAFIEAADKAGNNLEGASTDPSDPSAPKEAKVYPTVNNGTADVVLTEGGGFTAENGLLANATAELTFDKTPKTRTGSDTLYFNAAASLQTVKLSNVAASALKAQDVVAADYVLTVDGAGKEVGASYDSGETSLKGLTDVSFAEVADTAKTYSSSKLKITSAHGATRTMALPDVVVDKTTPMATVALSTAVSTQDVKFGSGSAETTATANLYNATITPKLTVTIANASSITSTADTVVVFNDGTGDVTVTGDKLTWSGTDTLTGTYDIDATSDSPQFAQNKPYYVKSATAKTLFDSGDPSVAADTTTSPVAFLVDTTAPIVTIAFHSADKVDVNDGSGEKLLGIVINKVKKEAAEGRIAITAGDVTFDTSASKVSLNGSDVTGTWAQSETDANKYVFTIKYSDLPEKTGQTIQVAAKDKSQNEKAYAFAGASEAGDATLIDSEAFQAGVATFAVDTKSVEFVSFDLYTNEACTTKASAPTQTGDIDYYDNSELYGKLVVKDALFSKANSSVTITKGASTEQKTGDDWQNGDSSANEKEYYIVYKFTESSSAYNIELVANDLAGNDSLERNAAKNPIVPRPFKLSHTAPSVEVTLNAPVAISKNETTADAAGATATAKVDYYASAVTATVKVSGIDLVQDSLEVTPKVSGGRDLGDAFSKTAWNPAADGDSYSCTVTFKESEFASDYVDSYWFEVTATDGASRKATYSYGQNGKDTSQAGGNGGTFSTKAGESASEVAVEGTRFVIDTVAPSVALGIDAPRANQAQTDKGDKATLTDFYAQAIEGTITVTDDHFDSTRATVKDAVGADLTLTQAWTQQTDAESGKKTNSWTAKVEFTADSDYGKFYGLNVVACDVLYDASSTGEAKNHATEYAYGDNTASQEKAGTTTTGATSTKAKDVVVNGARFAIDTKAPEIAISFAKEPTETKTDADSGEKTDCYYEGDSKGQPLTATVTVTDVNFDANTSKLEPTNGTVQNASSPWTDNGDGTYTATVQYGDTPPGSLADLKVIACDYIYVSDESKQIDKANEHYVTYEYGDAAGKYKDGTEATGVAVSTEANGAATDAAAFIVDVLSPTISFAASTTGKTLNGLVYYKGATTVTVNVYDASFDTETSEISYVDETGATQTVKPGASGWIAVDGKPGNYTYSLEFSKDNSKEKPYNITVTAYDKAVDPSTGELLHDSATKKYVDNGFVVDGTAPKIDVRLDQELVGTLNNVNYYATTDSSTKVLTATVVVTDLNFDTSTEVAAQNGTVVKSSGATWQQDSSDHSKWSAKVTFGETLAGATSSLSLSAKDLVGYQTDYKYGYNATSHANTSTLAGPASSGSPVMAYAGSFIVDTTAPTVSVQMQDSSGKALSPAWTDTQSKVDYYAKTPVAHVTVRDRNFDENTANSTLNAIGALSSNSLKWKQGSDKETWTVDITFGENLANVSDAVSQLSVLAVDKVYTVAKQANKSSDHLATWSYEQGQTKSNAFVTDLTAPTVRISFDKSVANSNAGTDYFGTAVTATISVVDRTFDSDGNVQMGTVVTKDGVAFTVGEWHRGQTDSNGNTTWTATVAFNDEGDHTLAVKVDDKAKYEASTNYAATSTRKASKFRIDTTDPEVGIQLDQQKRDTDSSGVDYFSKALKATITITDPLFKADQTTVTVDGSVNSSIQWRNPGEDTTVWQTTVSYSEGNKHELSVKTTDWAGHTTTAAYGDVKGKDGKAGVLGTTDSYGTAVSGSSFTIDETKPVVNFTINQSKIDTHNGVDYFSNKATGKKSAVLTVNVKDAHFNTDSKLNVITKNGKVQKKVEWKKDGSQWKAKVTFEESAENVLNVKVGDWARNVSSLKYGKSTTDADNKPLTSSSFTVDITAPQIKSARVSKEATGNYDDSHIFFDQDTTLTINVTDNFGLRSVNVVDAGKYYSKDVYLVDEAKAGAKSQKVKLKFANGVEFNRAIKLKTTDLANNSRTWSIAPNGKVKDVSGSSRRNTEVIDGIHPQVLVQDTVAPVIAFSGVEGGAYYNSAQNVTLDVNELNFRYLKEFDAEQSVITINRVSGDASAEHTSWEVPVDRFFAVNGNQNPAGLDGLYRYVETFGGDGHYSLSATLVDPAGNEAHAEVGEFTIDLTAPTVSVAFDNNNATNGSYYAAGRTATITVTEHNFNPSMVNVNTNGSIGGWTTNGDVHTATVTFGSDGVYNLSVTGSDPAGNAMSAYTAEQFTVDLTMPTVSISFIGGETDQSRAFNDVIQPVIVFSDEANYDSAGASFTLRGNKTGEVSYDFSRVGSDGGETVTFADFQRIISVDDIYTITATLTDMAGNQAAEATETFSVNRFGSNFIIISPAPRDSGSSDLGYLAEAPEIVIREINVNGIEESDVAVTYNLKTTSLERQNTRGRAGYTVQDVSTEADAGWQEYEYTIDKDSFVGEAGGDSPDGNYVVVLSSHDSAGNTNSSANFWVAKEDERNSADSAEVETDSERRMSAAVKFTLDTTPPDILGMSVENQEVVNMAGSQQVSFIATDNIGFDEKDGIEVLVDGAKADYDIDAAGKVTFELAEKPFAFQKVEVTVSDYADNSRTIGKGEGLTPELLVKVTSDVVDLYLPLLLGAGIGVIALAAIVGFGFIRPRVMAKNSAGEHSKRSDE